MSLSDTTCKSAKPKEKPYKLADSGGLYLEIMPNGSKLWRVKYRYLKKEKRLSLGAYPLTTLAEARNGRDAAKIKLKQNIDPSDARRDGRKQAERDAANSFIPMALEWHAKQKGRLSERYHAEVLHNLEKTYFPLSELDPYPN
ncbi:tyrosine-type recombinase/integrase [Flavobacterium sp. 3HN19-14]|uniref:tyrosine-type recombinase/integrase n=1 Tax=Flavobacterium sp. 3HN19-14 TaxID=3448133 RepID=UPI003EE3EE6D